LAHVTGDPAAVVAQAKKVAHDTLKAAWQQALLDLETQEPKLHPRPRQVIHTSLSEQQINQFLEFYAAWWPIDGEHDYSEARKQLDRLLAGRKALRDFARLGPVYSRFLAVVHGVRPRFLLRGRSITACGCVPASI
jgi:CRISPR-associated protein Cmr2